MTQLIQQATITDPNGSNNGKVADILIKNGKIAAIQSKISDFPAKTSILKAKGMHVAPGFVDVNVHSGEPGFEHKETLAQTASAALKSGITRMAIASGGMPATYSVAQIGYYKDKNVVMPVYLHAIGSATIGNKGENMTEIADLKAAGAIAVSDDKKTIKNAKLLELILQYADNFSVPVMHLPGLAEIENKGLMHEGTVSTAAGIRGWPEYAEVCGVFRDIEILKYAGGQLILSPITSSRAIAMIAKASKELKGLFCATSPQYLHFSDENLSSFDTLHKVYPPYRSKKDRQALIQAIKQKNIDFLISDHTPQDYDAKTLEFTFAESGISNIQTFFASAYTALQNDISAEEIVAILSTNARQLFNLPNAHIVENNEAELTVFDTNQNTILKSQDIESESRNNPFINTKLNGKVVATFCKGKWYNC